jgi:DMSO reductase family type II enzyme heme b subunit
MTGRRRLPLFWSVVLALGVVWAALAYGLPYLAMWVTGLGRPLAVPAVAKAIYLVLAVVGAAVYVTIRDESIREFCAPLVALVRGPGSRTPAARALAMLRLVLLGLVPLGVAGLVYARMAPRAVSPTILRVQHPTLPGAYERLRNPFREPSDETLRQWTADRKLTLALDEARLAYRGAALAEGREIFQTNCRPCHGDAADGAGPMAWGLRLKPTDFTDPGTIATVVEAYAYWRATEGGPGLPPEGTPWDSAMPAWRADLGDEQRWKAVMAAYDLAGVEPRKPERLPESRTPGPSLAAWLERWGPPPIWAQTRPAETPENLERGRQIYVKRCQLCHGDKGDGQGPVAPYLDPRPRDFTLGAYRIRSTASGEPPTDEDLFRVVSRGLPGTAMSGWPALSVEERWLVIAYVKRFSEAFRDKGTVVAPAREVSASPGAITRGKEIYEQAKCWECHGQEGRGDGPSAPTLKDDAGNRVRPTNLQKGWRLKGGREVRDIYLRVSAGMDGTPMPSFADSLAEEDRWALAHYVRSLQTRAEPSSDIVLRAPRVEGDLPRDVADPRWEAAPALAVPLAGQVIARPRWQTPSVDAVTVRALYTEDAIALLLEWDDPARDVEHRPGPVPDLKDATYPKLDLGVDRPRERLGDAVRLQFPITVPAGPERPHFFLGSPGRPVVLWHWRADLGEGRASAVVTERAEGPARVVELPADAREVRGLGTWAEGRWRVLLTRARVPKDPGRDVAFEPGRLIPFAIQAWDGSNGEKGLMMSLSSWSFLVLEPPRAARLYVVPVLAMALVGVAEWWLIRRVSARDAGLSPRGPRGMIGAP